MVHNQSSRMEESSVMQSNDKEHEKKEEVYSTSEVQRLLHLRTQDRTGLIMLVDLFLVSFLNISVWPVWWTKLATRQLLTAR